MTIYRPKEDDSMLAQLIIYRIKELCTYRNMSINALANSAGIPPSTIKNILNGQSKNPGIITLKKICDGLNVSLTEFFSTDSFKNLEQEIQ